MVALCHEILIGHAAMFTETGIHQKKKNAKHNIIFNAEVLKAFLLIGNKIFSPLLLCAAILLSSIREIN